MDRKAGKVVGGSGERDRGEREGGSERDEGGREEGIERAGDRASELLGKGRRRMTGSGRQKKTDRGG
jgi:hypothetical protein